MAEIAYLIIGGLVGAAVAYFAARGKNTATVALLDAERIARAEEKAQHAEQTDALRQEQAATLAETRAECERRITAAKAESEKQLAESKREGAELLATVRREHAERMAAAREDADKAMMVAKQEADKAMATAKQEADKALATAKQEADKALAAAKQEAQAQRAKELEDLQKRYDTMLLQFKAEVTTATERLLKERSGELQQANTQKMDELFRPIKDNITSLERSMNENREAAATRQTRLEDAIRQMMDSNAKIGSQADRLSTALQRKNKVTGNWGELILTELLESQGLTPGTHFDVQQTIRDERGRTVYNEETGSRMIPDVIMHLGDGREVVIDSKMSLTAFVDYQNAEDEASRQEALARHIDSVRTHIKELSGKDYSSYIAKPKASIDFVIMFVPVEGALQLALAEAPTLWREAFDKRVFIAGGQTLMAALHIIRLTWINIQQERNTQKIMKEAQMLIDRVAGFYKDFQAVGQKISDAAEAYAAVEKRVSIGKQSILSIGNHLEDLGVRGKKELPRVDE